MLRNYLAAALRNLARNRLYATLNISGLAIAMAAALLAALYVHEESTYDRFVPGHDRTYMVVAHLAPPDRSELVSDATPPYFAAWLRNDFPQIETVARLAPDRRFITHADVEALESIGWADEDFFALMPLPVIAGDPHAAMKVPDGAVLTRAMARKYFGNDTPIGETFNVHRVNPMRVLAVIEDLPPNANLSTGIFLSGKAASSSLAAHDRQPYAEGSFLVSVHTYLRLPRAADVATLQQEMPQFLTRHMKLAMEAGSAGTSLQLVPLHKLHLHPSNFGVTRPHNSAWVVTAIGTTGLLVLLVGLINFVNLSTARAARRAMEVGIRKVCGANRRNLIAQFLGESLLYALLGMLLALTLVELALPHLNAFLGQEIRFTWWRDPAASGAILALVTGAGALGGAYPAFLLSTFNPALVMQGGPIQATGSGGVRRLLVILQFSILIALMLATLIIHRQARHGLADGLRLDHDQMLLIHGYCGDAFANELRAIPGVRAVTCSSPLALGMGELNNYMRLPGGEQVLTSGGFVDFDFFNIYGLPVLAGRDFDRARPADVFSWKSEHGTSTVIINETAVSRFGFRSAAAAVGQSIGMDTGPGAELKTLEIIGVVPNFTIDILGRSITPTIYLVIPAQMNIQSVKLDGARIPETLRAIDALWKKTRQGWPINRRFLDEHIQELHAGIVRQGMLILVLAAVSLFVACLGLLGLSAFVVGRRTREIGIRKAMGAGRGSIWRMLLWDFSKPLLLANLLALPAGYFVMRHWLEQFASRIEIEAWMFVFAGAAALIVTQLTVCAQTLSVARARPVAALRHE